MSTPLGFSFSPSAGDIRVGGGGPQGPKPTGSGAPVASSPSSVEIKSLKLPQRQVPGQLAPSALLNGPGSAGSGVGLAQLLPLLMQAFAPQGQQPAGPVMPSGGMTPAPGGGYQVPAPSRSGMTPTSGGGYQAPGVPMAQQEAPQQPTGGWLGGLIDAGGTPGAGSIQPQPSPSHYGVRIIPSDTGELPKGEAPIGTIPPETRGPYYSPGWPDGGGSGDGNQPAPSLFEDHNQGDSALWSLYGRKAGLFNQMY